MAMEKIVEICKKFNIPESKLGIKAIHTQKEIRKARKTIKKIYSDAKKEAQKQYNECRCLEKVRVEIQITKSGYKETYQCKICGRLYEKYGKDN